MAVMAIRRRSLGVLIPCILLLHAGAFEARRSAAFAFSVVRNTRGGMIGGDFMTRGSTSAAAASDDDDDDDHEHYDDDDDDEDDDAVSTPSPRYFDLSGKTALITGSSGGIGKSIALTFANAGCDVILHYNERRDGALSTYGEINRRYRRYKRDVGSSSSSSSSSSSRTTSSPGMCLGVVCADFRDSRSVDAMFDAVVEGISRGKEGFRDAHPRRRLDVLVNNAGIVTKLAMEDDDDETLASYHETMAVNLHAPLRLMRRAHRHMKGSGGGGGGGGGGGVIINNTSVHGTRSVEYMTSYAASKAALESLTRGLAIEYAPDGVRVNAIAPGVVPVERTASMFSDRNVVDMWTPRIPLGRLGTVEDVAHATLLLATNEWMTGTVLTLDGGMMARANMPIRPRPAIPHPTPPPSQPRSKVPAGGGESGGYDDRLDSCRPEKGSSLRDVLFEVPSAT